MHHVAGRPDQRDGLAPAGHTEPGVDLLQMGAHRLRADPEGAGNLSVGETLGNKGHQLALPGRQRGDATTDEVQGAEVRDEVRTDEGGYGTISVVELAAAQAQEADPPGVSRGPGSGIIISRSTGRISLRSEYISLFCRFRRLQKSVPIVTERSPVRSG